MLNFLRHKFFKRQDRKCQQIVMKACTIAKNKFEAIENLNSKKASIVLLQDGVERGYERILSSSVCKDLNFRMVSRLADSDCVVFLNTIDFSVDLRGRKVILFLHEPSVLMDRYVSIEPPEGCSATQFHVVTHLNDEVLRSSLLLSSVYCVHRGIPYINFHHGSSYDELIDRSHDHDFSQRLQRMVLMTSALSGMGGYDLRRQVFESICAVGTPLDLFGRYSRQMLKFKNYQGPVGLKVDVYNRYKFVLVVENCIEEGYLSEKIFDALLCGCFPVYVGSRTVFEYIPEDWFLFIDPEDPDAYNSIQTALNSVDPLFFTPEQWRMRIAEIYRKCSFGAKLTKMIEELSHDGMQ